MAREEVGESWEAALSSREEEVKVDDRGQRKWECGCSVGRAHGVCQRRVRDNRGLRCLHSHWPP